MRALAAGRHRKYYRTSRNLMLDQLPKPSLPKPQCVTVDDDWFDVVKVADYLYAIMEPRHYEHTVLNLLVGEDRAILIDTGCGIGNPKAVVEQLTRLPVTVINTHTHLDHLGGNHQFRDIMMFDHPRSRSLSRDGAPQQTLFWELHQRHGGDAALAQGLRARQGEPAAFRRVALAGAWRGH